MKGFYESKVKKSSRSLVLLSAFTIVVAIVWASEAKIHDVVKGGGRIIPQARTQQVQHLEGGIVQAILVHEGDHVKKGDELFVINSLATNAEFNELSITRLFSEIKIARLTAEKDGLDHFDTSAIIASHLESSMNVHEAIQAEVALFDARRNEFLRSVSILEEQANQKKLVIEKLETEKKNRGEELNVARRQTEINLRLRAKGVVSESKLLDSQSKLTSIETQIASANSQIPVVQAELKELSEKLKRVGEERISKIVDELSHERLKLEQIDEQLKKLTDKLARATVVSPSRAIVNRILVTTPGAVVQPGALLLELTPTEGDVLVEGRVRAQDRGRIWIGQDAIVRVSAYDFTHYGGLAGNVMDISADSFTEEGLGSYYRVKIKLRSDTFDEKSDIKVMPGMTVDFHIQTGVRSIMEMILSPVLEELWFTTSPLKSAAEL